MGKTYPWVRWISAAKAKLKGLSAEISPPGKGNLGSTALCPPNGNKYKNKCNMVFVSRSSKRHDYTN